MAKKKKTMSKQRESKPVVKLKPLGDRVLIEEEREKEGMTDSGIYIPDSVKEDKGSKKGVVIAVGPGKYDDGKFIPVSLSVGDNVLFQWGDKISVDGREYYIVRESEIIAVIK